MLGTFLQAFIDSCKGIALGAVVAIVALYLFGDRWWLALPVMAAFYAVIEVIEFYKANENQSGQDGRPVS